MYEGAVCCLCLMAVSQVSSIINWTNWAQSVSKGVSSGTSLKENTVSSLMETGYSITCGIFIDNWTKWPLVRPDWNTEAGSFSTLPRTVFTGQREVYVSHKDEYTVTGTHGTVSWLLDDRKRVVVMWSVPYSLSVSSNWLAIGITKNGQTTHREFWLDTLMYYGSKEDDLNLIFRRQEYQSKSKSISVNDNEIEITADMEIGYKPKVAVIVRPLQEQHLADSLKRIIPKSNQ